MSIEHSKNKEKDEVKETKKPLQPIEFCNNGAQLEAFSRLLRERNKKKEETTQEI